MHHLKFSANNVCARTMTLSSGASSPDAADAGDLALCGGDRHVILSGRLLAYGTKSRHSLRLARAARGSLVERAFWRQCSVVLSEDALAIWCCTASLSQYTIDSYPPWRELSLEDVDEITMCEREIIIHCRSAQNSMHLEAPSDEEAMKWVSAVRAATAAKLGEQLPLGWDVDAMLVGSSSSGRLVNKEALPDSLVSIVQRLFDHTFVCRKTKDRKGQEFPLRLEVSKVIRVENGSAWRQYSKARARVGEAISKLPESPTRLSPEVMTATLGDPMVQNVLGELDDVSYEHWLFHGTTSAGIQGISNKEFRMELAGTHRGTLYGKGVYCSESTTKADEYAEADEQDGLCRMLICRAALGRVLVDTLRKPSPDLMERCKEGFDSVCGDRVAAVGTYREFIFYDGSQVYPAYIIAYRRVMQAEFLQAISCASDHEGLRSATQLMPHAARLAETHFDDVVRYRINLTLNSNAASTVRALTSCLLDQRKNVRLIALATLRQLAASTRGLGKDYNVGLFRAGDVGPPEEPAVVAALPELTQCLLSSDEETRRAALEVLCELRQYAARAVPALIESFEDPDESVRTVVATVLGHVPADAIPAVPVLLECLRHESIGNDLRKEVANTLGRICAHSKTLVSDLMEVLSSGNDHARVQAAVALELAGRHATQAAPALGSSIISDPNDDVRVCCARALGELGADAFVAIPALIGALQNSNAAVREVSAKALGQVGTSASSTVPALVKLLGDSSENVRLAAILALKDMGETASPAIPMVLRHTVREKNDQIRLAVVQLLAQLTAYGALGGNAAAVQKHLQQCLKDTNEGIRKEATLGLSYHAARTQWQSALSIRRGVSNEKSFGDDEDRVDRLEALVKNLTDSVGHRAKSGSKSVQKPGKPKQKSDARTDSPVQVTKVTPGSAITELLRQSPSNIGPTTIPPDPLQESLLIQERIVFDPEEASASPRARCESDGLGLCSCRCVTK